MSIFQQQDKNGRWSMMGDGVVVARQGNPAIHESLAYGEKRVPKITFNLKVGTIAERNEIGETIYRNHTVNCAVYGVVGQELLYSFAKNLKSGDTVAFWGRLWEKQADGNGDANGANYQEIQISSILPISDLLRMVMGTDGNDFAKLEVKAARESGLESGKKKQRKGKGDLPF